MTARTHDLAAITGLFCVLFFLPSLPQVTLGTAIACLLANQLGGIAPDIDQPTAPFWRNLPVGGFFGKIITKMLGGHRFLTHSIIGVVLLGWLAKLLLVFIHPLFPRLDTGYIWWAFIIGVFSHLIMDSFTREGVPWLLPIPIKFGFPPIRKLRIVTGKKMENFVVFPGIIVFNLAFCALYYQELLALLHSHII